MMPPKLPKTLPPKHAIDHKIELVLGSKPHSKAPYRMSPMELVEMGKQLLELLDSSYIQPSKAPYGTSILF